MGRIYQQLPPLDKPLAIAFSGGLDTCAAVAWLSRQGVQVYAYTANLAQPDEEDIAVIPEIARQYGACSAALLDCRAALVQEGMIALCCGAFHIGLAGKKYFNTTPLGRAVTAPAIVHAMKKDKVSIFGDGSTHKGNDIERFYRYALLFQPELKFYKPWLDERFVKEIGGRREMSQFLEDIGKPYSQQVEKAYSTDANILGATHEAKDLEYLDRSLYVVEPLMGVAFWKEWHSIQAEKVTVGFLSGMPCSINGKEFSDLVQLIATANQIGGRHGLGMSDQVENRLMEAKSRGIYEAPGMALLHICYERLLSLVHNEKTLDIYYSFGRRLGRFLYEGRWYDPQAMLLKDALVRWVAAPISGEVELELRCGDDWTILQSEASLQSYHSEKLSMEKTKAAFTPADRIGALAIQELAVADSRNLLSEYMRQRERVIASQAIDSQLAQLAD